MIDFYSAHIIAREEHEAFKRSIDPYYAESVGPRQPGWLFMRIGGLLTGLGSALTVMDMRSKRDPILDVPRQSQLEQQPCLEC